MTTGPARRGPGSGGHTIITGAKIFDSIGRTGLPRAKLKVDEIVRYM